MCLFYEDDFFDMLVDFRLIDEAERKRLCRKKCPVYKTCKGNIKKCKFTGKKKKKGLFR